MGMSNAPQGGQTSRIETAAQLEARQAVRREIEVQLQAITDRRGRLVQERLNAQAASNQVIAKEIEGQIAELSARIARLERQKLQADDAIMDAITRGVGQQAEETSIHIAPVPPVPPTPGETFTLLPPSPHELTWVQLNAERLLAFQGLALVLLGVALWRVARRGRRPTELHGTSEMRQAVDAIAVEVERISENQRYVTKLLAERLGEGPAKPLETNAKDRVDAR